MLRIEWLGSLAVCEGVSVDYLPLPAARSRIPAMSLSIDPVDYDQMTDLKRFIAFVAGRFRDQSNFVP